MTVQNKFAGAFNSIINKVGTQIKIQYFTQTVGSVWDDDITLTQSGVDLWTSGVVLPLSQQRGSSESVLLEQGKLINDDKKLFIHGSLILTGSEMSISIQTGSPTGDNFTMLDSNIRVDVSNTPIYRKVFLRLIGGTGSLQGE